MEQQTNSSKDGVRRCPSCGSVVDSFATRCPYCDAELRNTTVASSVEKFTEKLGEYGDVKLSYGMDETPKKHKVGCLTIGLWVFFFPIMLIYHAARIIIALYSEPKFDGVDRRKQDFILNYPVPNSREDLLEFFIMCANRIESISIGKMFTHSAAEIGAWNKIWAKKLDALEQKANLSMKDDSASMAEVQRIMSEAQEKIAQNQKQCKVFSITVVGLLVLFFALCFILDTIGR